MNKKEPKAITAKIPTLDDKQVKEVLDIIQNPEKHDITWAEFMRMITQLGEVASLMNQVTNPQADLSKVEEKINGLERRTEAIEDKLNAVCRAFGGDHYDGY